MGAPWRLSMSFRSYLFTNAIKTKVVDLVEKTTLVFSILM
jgi:hypothetical protein